MFVISYSEVDIYISQWIFFYSNFKIFLENNVKSAVSVNISCCESKVLQMEYTKAWHSLACATSTTQWMWNPSLGPNFTDSDMMERLALVRLQFANCEIGKKLLRFSLKRDEKKCQKGHVRGRDWNGGESEVPDFAMISSFLQLYVDL